MESSQDRLVLVNELQPKSSLALIRKIGGSCSGVADLKDFAIGKVLTQFEPPQQHLGELIRARERELAGVNFGAGSRAIGVAEPFAAQRGGKTVGPGIRRDARDSIPVGVTAIESRAALVPVGKFDGQRQGIDGLESSHRRPSRARGVFR